MTDFWFPPLEDGARVVTDVFTESDFRYAEIIQHLPPTDVVDLVLVAVPAGEGCAVEAAIRRALRVEGA